MEGPRLSMDDERKAWQKQFTSNFGAREFVRFMAALIVWIFVGVAVGVALRSPLVFVLLLFTGFVSPLSIYYSRRAYRIFRFILGNPNLPTEPMPRAKVKAPHEPRPWWSFIPGIWFWILTLALLYLAIRYFLK